MAMFVAVSTYVRPLEEVDAHRADHLAWVAVQYETGRILVSGRRTPPEGGVLVVRGDDRDEVTAALATDPYARAGLLSYELLEFEPADAATTSPWFRTFQDTWQG